MKNWPSKPMASLGPVADGDWILKENYTADGVRLIQVGDVGEGEFIGKSSRFISLKRAKELQCSFLKAGDVLISRMPDPLGRACIFPGLNCPAITAVDVAIFRPEPSKANSQFINYFLNSKPWFDEVLRYATGTTRSRISRSRLEQLDVPVPPLAEQERIVKLLDEVDELRKVRTQADRRTRALIPSLFHDMFGDPITNSKGWPQSVFAEVGKLDRGRSKNRPRDEPSLYGGKYPFIQTGDVANSNGEITAYTQTYSDKGLAQSRLWSAGTLCITIAANIGKTAILTFPACFPDSMVGFVPGEQVVVDYVRQWLVTMESRLEEAAPQMAQKNINLKILSELAIPVPPIALQKEFAARVAEIRGLETEQSASRHRLDDLFQSLLHRAFNGEL